MVRPGMSDGRAFTSYESNCQMNMLNMSRLNMTDNNVYRKYLQDNAEMLIKGSIVQADNMVKEYALKQ